MKPPRLTGVVERRLLVNYRTDPEVTARLLPAPLRPQTVDGWAVSGICLIRLGHLRPSTRSVAPGSRSSGPGRSLPGSPDLGRSLPGSPARSGSRPFSPPRFGLPRFGLPSVGLRSENAAHRIAVEWDTPDGPAAGVYIPRRDTGSILNALAGGRLFPGVHHRARFDVRETPDDLRVGFTSLDGAASVRVHARTGSGWRDSTLFADVDEASEFFRCGAVGYSARRASDRLDGLELCADRWRVEPVEVLDAYSSFFADPALFPPGSATLDGALLMRNVTVTWNPLPTMLVAADR